MKGTKQHVVKVILGGPRTTVRLLGYTNYDERRFCTASDVEKNQASARAALANFNFTPKMLGPRER